MSQPRLDVHIHAKSRILLSLLAPHTFIAENLFEHLVNVGHHIFSLHTSSLFLKRPPRTCSVESGTSVRCQKSDMFAQIGFLARRRVTDVPVVQNGVSANPKAQNKVSLELILTRKRP